MKNAAIASAILHLIILILFSVSIGNPFQRTIKDQQPIVVDFVQIAEKSAAPKLSPMNQKMEEPKAAPKEEKKKVEVEESKPEPEENRAEKPKEPEPPKEPGKPEEKPIEKPKEEEKPEPKEEAEPILKKEPEKKPEKKPEPPKKPEKKAEKKPEPKKKDKKDPKKDKKDKKKKDEKAEVNLRKKTKSNKKEDPKNKKSASASLDDLLKEVDKDNEGASEDGSPAETVGEVITATQIDAIRQKIRKCWLVPAGLKGAKDMVVDIKMEIGPDGTVKKAEIVDKARMAQDSGFRTAAENARRAVLDPECNPLPLPKEKYEQWKDLEMSFNPKDMF